MADRQFVERDAQAVEIGAMVRRATLGQFRRQVGSVFEADVGTDVQGDEGEPDDLHHAVVAYKDIGRAYIAVEDAVLVSVTQGTGDLFYHVQETRQWQGGDLGERGADSGL